MNPLDPPMADRALLLVIIGRLDRLESLVSRLSPETRFSRHDRLVLIRLLAALYATYEAAPFTARDVLEAATLRPLCLDRSAKALGKLFARASGVFINGVMVERYGLIGNSTL